MDLPENLQKLICFQYKYMHIGHLTKTELAENNIQAGNLFPLNGLKDCVTLSFHKMSVPWARPLEIELTRCKRTVETPLRLCP